MSDEVTTTDTAHTDTAQEQQSEPKETISVRTGDPFDLIDKGGSQFVVHFHGKSKWSLKETFDTAGISDEDRKLFAETGALGKLDYVPIHRLENISKIAEERGWSKDQEELVYMFNEILRALSDCYRWYTDNSFPGFEDGWRFVPATIVEKRVRKLADGTEVEEEITQVQKVQETLSHYQEAVRARAKYVSQHLEDLYALQLPRVRMRIRANAVKANHIEDADEHANLCMTRLKRRIPQTPEQFQRAIGIDFGKRSLKTPGLLHGDVSELQASKSRVKTWATSAGDYMIDKFVDVFRDLKERKMVHKGSLKAHKRAFEAFEQMNAFIRNDAASDLVKDFRDYHQKVDADDLRDGEEALEEFKEMVDELIDDLNELKGRAVNPFGADGRALL